MNSIPVAVSIVAAMASVDVLPPPYSLSNSSLPSFTSGLGLDEESLQFQPVDNSDPDHHDYVYSSKSMVLNLGRRFHGASQPTYGANSEIRGCVIVKDTKSVKSITVKISGTVSYLVLEDGFSSYTQCKIVLQHSRTLYSSKSPQALPSSSYPLSFSIPTYALQSNAQLPPTIHNSITSDPSTHLSINLNVRYRIDVEIKRYGLHRHERVGTEWWHAPRSFALPNRPRGAAASERAAWESDVKTHPHSPDDPEEWHTCHIGLDGSSSSDRGFEISLPRRLSYALGESIPIRILFGPAILNDPNDLRHLSLKLVKRVSFELGYSATEIAKPVADATICDMRSGEQTWTALGNVKVPSSEEPSWRVSPFTETSYALQLTFVTPSNSKTYEAEIPLRITSDEEAALQFEGDEAWTRPARSQIETLEASSHHTQQRSIFPATVTKFFKSIL